MECIFLIYIINMTTISVWWRLREFFTLQEKGDFMLLLAISIFVVIISVIILLYFFHDCIFYVVLNVRSKQQSVVLNFRG